MSVLDGQAGQNPGLAHEVNISSLTSTVQLKSTGQIYKTENITYLQRWRVERAEALSGEKIKCPEDDEN